MKAFFSKLNFKAPAWLNLVSLVLGILSTLFFGTTNTITVDGKNGSEITVTLKATAIPAALEDCDFKKLGDKCAVKSEVDAEMTKAPTITEEVKPAVAPVAAPVIEPKSVVQAAPDVDIKAAPAGEVKPEEVKPDVDTKK